MKVSELIEMLRHCDPDDWVIAHEEGNPYPVNLVVRGKEYGRYVDAKLPPDKHVSVIFLDFDPEILSLVNDIEKVVEENGTL